MEVTLIEAAAAYQVSIQTIRRRLAKDLIKGQKRQTPQGFIWMIDLEEETATTPPLEEVTNGAGAHVNATLGAGALVGQMQARIDSLEAQLTTRAGEIDHLHQLLAQTALNAAPGRPWWKFWP
tara:strand:+ start:300 stop:668 length:369 start_codon:yes stop_codon:yes gene_type:complete